MLTRMRQGFTLIELLIVVAVTTLGFVALFDLQASTLRGMASMRRMLEATMLAENFIETLRLELSAWTPGSNLGNPALFPHLSDLPTDASAQAGSQTTGDATGDLAPGWIIADQEASADRRVSMAGDLHPLDFNAGIRAAMLEPGMEDVQQPFCLLYRLTWLIPGAAIRAEVEVSWPLDTADMESFLLCDFNASTRLDQVRSVTLTSTLSTNLFHR